MSATQKIPEAQPGPTTSPSQKLTLVATGLAGAAALGLIGAVAAPALPVVSILGASIGLVVGLMSTKLDKR